MFTRSWPPVRVLSPRPQHNPLSDRKWSGPGELMEMLGHTTPTVTMIYQAAGAERMQAIANRLDDQWAQLSHTAAD